MAEGHLTEEDDLQRLAQASRGARRGAFSCSSISNAAIQGYVPPVYPKDSVNHEGIKAFIRSSDKVEVQVLFGKLDDASLDQVINAFQLVEAHQGADLIRQGDDGGCLYLIAEGAVDVFVARPDETGCIRPGDRGGLVCSLDAGAIVGELALMYSAPRSATVAIASEVCSLWQLEREPFKMLLVQQSQCQFSLYEGWLQEVEIFRLLNRYELSRLSELLESTPYDAGEEIITQGTHGTRFYILEDGSCAAYILGPDGEVPVKEYVQPGDYFGELALLTSEPRAASVRATGEGALVLSVSKEDFTQVLGPIQDILKLGAASYAQYASFFDN